MEVIQKQHYLAPRTEVHEVQSEDGLLNVSNGINEKYGKSGYSYNDSDFN